MAINENGRLIISYVEYMILNVVLKDGFCSLT